MRFRAIHGKRQQLFLAMSTPAHHLHIVAACTDRKRGEIPSELRLREIPQEEASARAEVWWGRLEAAMPRSTALDVYAGEHWTLVQEIKNTCIGHGWRVHLWVASAGYGLLWAETEITPYSCTFSEGSADQVASGVPSTQRAAYNQAWWSALGRLRQSKTEPSTLRALVERDPRASFLVLGSPDYVRAMHGDLSDALERLHRREWLTIVTSGTGWEHDILGANVLAIDARTRTKWGGTMQGLHARSALHLLEDAEALRTPFSTADLRAKYERLVADTSKPKKFNRARMTDEQVLDFLRAKLAKEPNAGHTRLLRELRDSDRACEQKRFRQLHAQLAEELRAGTTR